MPSSLASRAAESHDVSVKSDRYVETFSAGLKSFVNEARLLARFDHPSLVKVYQFFEANQTAYMAMPYYEGPTLKSALAEMGHPPDEAQLREWLRPLLSALAAMHKEHCWHRDIAPDNILLTPSGPLLLDFGAARRVIGDMTHALTVVLKPGYAPIEQYGEAASMAQGPWTDLYALASVVYFAITGRPPTTSVERVMGDEMTSLWSKAHGRYSDSFLSAIDATLSVRPKDRPQDVAAFCELLNRGLTADDPARFRASTLHATGFDAPAGPVSRFGSPATVQLPPTELLPPAATIHPAPEPEPDVAALAPPPRAVPAAAPSSASRTLVLGALGILGLAALGFYFGTRPEQAPVAPAVQAVPDSAVAKPAALATPEPAAPSAMPAASETPAVTPAPAPADGPAKPAVTQQVRKAPAAPPALAPRVEAPPKNAGVKPARCSDILQKASLESLSPEEAEYLRKECR